MWKSIFIATLAASAIAAPAMAADLEADGRRYALVLFQVLDTGNVQPVQIPNGTFSTEAGCDKAAQKLIEKFSRSKLRPQFIHECLDRGSAY